MLSHTIAFRRFLTSLYYDLLIFSRPLYGQLLIFSHGFLAPACDRPLPNVSSLIYRLLCDAIPLPTSLHIIAYGHPMHATATVVLVVV